MAYILNLVMLMMMSCFVLLCQHNFRATICDLSLRLSDHKSETLRALCHPVMIILHNKNGSLICWEFDRNSNTLTLQLFYHTSYLFSHHQVNWDRKLDDDSGQEFCNIPYTHAFHNTLKWQFPTSTLIWRSVQQHAEYKLRQDDS